MSGTKQPNLARSAWMLDKRLFNQIVESCSTDTFGASHGPDGKFDGGELVVFPPPVPVVLVEDAGGGAGGALVPFNPVCGKLIGGMLGKKN
jgi:hypothetical protein